MEEEDKREEDAGQEDKEEKKESEEPQQEEAKTVFDDNASITDDDKLPIHVPLTPLRYKTIKKNNALGWWTAVVLLEDHGKKLVCLYRWRKRNKEWKRDKKIAFHSAKEWFDIKEAVEVYLKDLN